MSTPRRKKTPCRQCWGSHRPDRACDPARLARRMCPPEDRVIPPPTNPGTASIAEQLADLGPPEPMGVWE